MIESLIRLSARTFFHMIFWIFALSIPLRGQTLYQHGYDIFVDNQIVEAVQEQVKIVWNESMLLAGDLWDRVMPFTSKSAETPPVKTTRK